MKLIVIRSSSLALVIALALACGVSTSSSSAPAGPLPAPAQDIAPAKNSAERQTAVLAGGCFWCVEAVFESLNGVEKVVSGFAGGTAKEADYAAVSAGKTKHAEVVEITFNPATVSYGQLLRVFFATHDPTTLDRQGPDWGHQYRSAIFYATPDQKNVAEAYLKQLQEAKVFAEPIVTTLEPLDKFYPAEEYHQDFVARHPDHSYVRAWVPAKLEKLKKNYADLLKK